MSDSKLNSLKSQLKKLRDARDAVRMGSALAGILSWIAGTLGVWFALDYGFNLSSLHRGLMMLLTLPVMAYGFNHVFSTLKGWGLP